MIFIEMWKVMMTSSRKAEQNFTLFSETMLFGLLLIIDPPLVTGPSSARMHFCRSPAPAAEREKNGTYCNLMERSGCWEVVPQEMCCLTIEQVLTSINHTRTQYAANGLQYISGGSGKPLDFHSLTILSSRKLSCKLDTYLHMHMLMSWDVLRYGTCVCVGGLDICAHTSSYSFHGVATSLLPSNG